MSELALRSASRALYDELVAEHTRASYAVARVASRTVESSLKSWQGALAQAGRVIGDLAPTGRITLALIAGAPTPPAKPGDPPMTWERWKDIAGVQRDLIAHVLRETGSAPYTLGRFWTEVVSQTGSDVKRGVTEVAGKVADLTPWVSVALVALVVGYVLFAARGLR